MSNRILRHVWGSILVLAANGCAGPSSTLNPAGPQAGRIASLWWLFLWITAAVYVLVIIATLLTVRRGPGDAAEVLCPDPKVERKLTTVVSLLVGITAVILFTLMFADLLTGRALQAKEGNPPLPIQVTGHQWWWEIQYQDGSPSNWVNSANELHIPTGRMIQFDLKSVDVIHSFWFPNLHGKKDLVPGHPTTVFFRADRPGTYFGQCAEFCGLQHAHMRLTLVAEDPQKFSDWYKSQQQPAPEPSGESEKRGKQLFLSSSCILCHTIQGTMAAARVGPELTHISGRRMIGAGTLTNEPASLSAWILDPQQFKPGAKMPHNPFTPDDLNSVVAYLRTLK